MMDAIPTAIQATFHKTVAGRQQMLRDCDLITRVTNHGDGPVDVVIVIGHAGVGCVQSFTLPPGGSRAPLDGGHPIPVYALQFRDIWIDAGRPVTVECALLEPGVRRIRGPIAVGMVHVEYVVGEDVPADVAQQIRISSVNLESGRLVISIREGELCTEPNVDWRSSTFETAPDFDASRLLIISARCFSDFKLVISCPRDFSPYVEHGSELITFAPPAVPSGAPDVTVRIMSDTLEIHGLDERVLSIVVEASHRRQDYCAVRFHLKYMERSIELSSLSDDLLLLVFATVPDGPDCTAVCCVSKRFHVLMVSTRQRGTVIHHYRYGDKWRKCGALEDLTVHADSTSLGCIAMLPQPGKLTRLNVLSAAPFLSRDILQLSRLQSLRSLKFVSNPSLAHGFFLDLVGASLTQLDISGVAGARNTMALLDRLPLLQDLDASRTDLTDRELLKYLPCTLTRLRLDSVVTNESFILDLRGLPVLADLDLSSTRIECALLPSRLTSLQLSQCDWIDLSLLTADMVGALAKVDLFGVDADPDELASFLRLLPTSLVDLGIGGPLYKDDAMVSLVCERFPELTRLDLSVSSFVTVEGLSVLSRLTRLHNLVLVDYEHLTSAAAVRTLRVPASVRVLEIDAPDDGDVVASVAHLTAHLTKLYLHGCDLDASKFECCSGCDVVCGAIDTLTFTL